MRDLKKWILNDLMNEEAEEQINASRYERERSNSLWHMDWTKYSDSEKLIIPYVYY